MLYGNPPNVTKSLVICLGPSAQGGTKHSEESFGIDMKFLFLEFDDTFMGFYTCQNSESGIV